MKRKLLLALALLSAVCCIAMAARAEADGYWVDLPDEISVSLYEYIQAFYGCPAGGSISISCSNPEALQDLGTGYVERGPYRYFRMKALGQYTLQFTGDGFSKNVCVNVTNAPTALRLEQDTITVEAGKTVHLRYTTEGGTFYNPIGAYNTNALLVEKEAGDVCAVTGLQTGRYAVRFANELAALTVYVVDPCEGVKLSMQYDRGSVGYYLPITTVDRQGNPAYARMELTKGDDCAEMSYNETYAFLYGVKSGWVTVKAYGTDGSTDEARLKIYEAPTDLQVSLSATAIRAGESLTVNAKYLPEGAWYPLQIEIASLDQHPASEELSGPVAVVHGNTVTGVVPGTCELQVFSGGVHERYTITVTDSDQALVFDRPEPYFDWREPCQLSVHTRAGAPVSAEYSAAGAYISVTPDGVLTCTDVNGNGHVTVQLENGLSYRFPVRAAEFPAWLAPEAEVISMPIDIVSCEMCQILSDISITAPSTHLLLCSNDESVVKIDNWRIYPQSVGTATLTVWSRYNDVSCNVLVNVTEPYGRLFVDGTPDQTSMKIAYNTTVSLPTVTDYWGNPVNVTWNVTYQSSYPSGKQVVSLIKNKQLKCTYYDGYAELYATAASGAAFKLSVFAYQRDTTCSFRESEYTVTTGSFVQVDFQYGGYLNNSMTLEPQDVTFTVTGDTGCVLVDSHFSYHTFTGLREGTVTLTAKLYNGKTAKTAIHVALPESCKNGHDPEWYVQEEPTATLNGVRARRCSRCHVPLGQEQAIPCTGELGFTAPDVYLREGGAALLTATLNGDPKQSFTYRSSNPNVAQVVGDVVVGVGLGTATVTVTKDDCAPATCRVHVIVATLTLPAGLVEIEDGAFQGVTVTRVVLPAHVTAIGAYAFADCPSLAELAIPASVTYIGENAFANDPSLTLTVTHGSYAEQYCIAHKLAYRYADD